MHKTTRHRTTLPFHRTRTAALALAVSAVSALAGMPTAVAADNPGSHQHGQALLQLAVDGEQLELTLESPAANLAGFERAARSAEERQQLNDIRHWLTANPLVDTVPASCRVTATVFDEEPEAGADGDHHHGGDEHRESHSDYRLSQSLHCPGATTASRLRSALPERFPALEQLQVQWLTPQGQGSTVLTAAQAEFHTQP